MLKFEYKAIDPAGKEVTSSISGDTEADVVRLLSEKNLTVLDIQEAKGKANSENEFGEPIEEVSGKFASAISMKVILTFYEQLSFLLGAGIPIHLSLKMTMDNTKEAQLVKIIKRMLFDLTEGVTFSASLRKYPKHFPSLHMHVISVGEKTGTMEKSLIQLVELTKERLELESQAIKAAAYPLFIFCVSMTLALGMILVVFPKFEDMFSSFEAKLPFITMMMMKVSHIATDNTMTVLLSVFGLMASVIYFFVSPSQFETREKVMLSLPIVRDIYLSLFVSQFSKTLSSTLKSGIPLLDGLLICRQTLMGGRRQQFLDALIKGVREGVPMSIAMERYGMVPELVWQLTTVGEKTGQMGLIMDNLFTFYKKRYQDLMTSLTSILQPAMMFGAAIFVGVMAGALFIPIFKMGTNMKRPD